MGKTRTFLCVDGNNLLVRAVKAMERTNLGVGNVPTGGVNTFVRMLSRYVREVKPDRVVVCWDGGRSKHRMTAFPEYKAGRVSRPDEEAEESPFALAKEFLTLSNIHHVEFPHVEADDLVAAYWRHKDNETQFIILSGDKDFLQLLDGWTEQIRPGTGDDERWTVNRVRTEIGCRPEHLPLVMALTGDNGDNVPGIPGFGMKTACKFLKKYDWNLEKLVAAHEKKLFGQAEAVYRNLTLVDLRNAYEGIPRVEVPPLFAPTDATSILYQDLLGYLMRYKMRYVIDQLQTGTLWKDREDGRVSRQPV